MKVKKGFEGKGVRNGRIEGLNVVVKDFRRRAID